MHFNVLNRKLHHWTSFALALPLLVIIASGLLLQVKKQWSWVQPPEHRGSATTPNVGFERMLDTLRALPELGVHGWDDVDRLDVRPGRGVAKVILRTGWEAQIDLGSGEVLQTAYRRSDLIESIHDGSFFAGDWTKLGLFFPAGIALLLLWLSGLWMVWVPFAGKRRRRRQQRNRLAAAFVMFLMPAIAIASQQALAVDPIVGHWEVTKEGNDTVVLADARRWRTEPAATPFPVAAVRGVADVTDATLAVKFKMIAGESDQIAGLAFGISSPNAYYYVRYNTKDGNIALWQFDGDRKRLLEGSEHIQLPLGVWHDLRVEIRGARIVGWVNDRLKLEYTLPAPVKGGVGFWTKRDSVTAFKDFTIERR